MDSALSISFSTAALLPQRSAQPRPLNTSIRRPGQHGRHQSATVPRAGRGRPVTDRAPNRAPGDHGAPDRESDAAAGRRTDDDGAAHHHGAPDRESDATARGAADDGSAHHHGAPDRESDAKTSSAADDGSALSAPDDGPADRESHAAAGRTADDAAPDDQADGQGNHQTDAAPRTNSQADDKDARPDAPPDGPF